MKDTRDQGAPSRDSRGITAQAKGYRREKYTIMQLASRVVAHQLAQVNSDYTQR